MPSCAFRKCTNNSRNTNKANGVTFHSFPQEARSKEVWIKIIQEDQSDEEWLPTQFSRVCSAHFKENDFYLTTRGLRKIKASVVPSFRPIDEPIKENHVQEIDHVSSPLSDVYVSDTDSIFDSPSEISLKKQLRIEKSKREQCRKQNIRLKRQIIHLKNKNASLQQVVKFLKENKTNESLIVPVSEGELNTKSTHLHIDAH